MEEQCRIEEFCDLGELDRLLESWPKASQMPTTVRHLDGSPVTRLHGLTDYCASINSSESVCALCTQFHAPQGNVVQCHGGLSDFAEPVTIPDGTAVVTCTACFIGIDKTTLLRPHLHG